jgi:hypothetical protein
MIVSAAEELWRRRSGWISGKKERGKKTNLDILLFKHEF